MVWDNQSLGGYLLDPCENLKLDRNSSNSDLFMRKCFLNSLNYIFFQCVIFRGMEGMEGMNGMG